MVRRMSPATAELQTETSSPSPLISIAEAEYEPLNIYESKKLSSGSELLRRCNWHLPEGAELVAAPAQVVSAISRLVDHVLGPMVRETWRELGEPTVLIQVLEGGGFFGTHLAQTIGCHIEMASLLIDSSEVNSDGIREPVWRSTLPEVHNRSVFLVTDVIHSGHALQVVRDRIVAAGAREVKSIALVDKVVRNRVVRPDFAALKVSGPVAGKWLAGCGMDWNKELRFLDWILAAPPHSVVVDHLKGKAGD